MRILPPAAAYRIHSTNQTIVNGNHLSNDGAFIEKRRRGLARFLNALVRHPILSQEQLAIMFLTVPTVRFLSSLGQPNPWDSAGMLIVANIT
jgi:hypothetical protein